MVEILLYTAIIIAISMSLLCIKVILKRGGRFSSQHIHDSIAMRERGIHCVMEQDKEMRGALCLDEHSGCTSCAIKDKCKEINNK